MDHPLRISRRSGLIEVGMICTYLYFGIQQILVLVSILRLIRKGMTVADDHW